MTEQDLAELEKAAADPCSCWPREVSELIAEVRRLQDAFRRVAEGECNSVHEYGFSCDCRGFAQDVLDGREG